MSLSKFGTHILDHSVRKRLKRQSGQEPPKKVIRFDDDTNRSTDVFDDLVLQINDIRGQLITLRKDAESRFSEDALKKVSDKIIKQVNELKDLLHNVEDPRTVAREEILHALRRIHILHEVDKKRKLNRM